MFLSSLYPIEVRDTETRRRAFEAAYAMTFDQCAKAYIASHKAPLKNPKHADQWANTLDTYAGTIIGSLPVQHVNTAFLLKILEPI